jgi:type IV pilus assembly protein PilC
MLNRFFTKKNQSLETANTETLALKMKANRQLARERLLAEHPTLAEKKKRPAFGFLKRRSVSGKDLAIFTRQLAATINAGLLLTEALETISDEAENAYLQEVLEQVQRDIQSGHDFSSALMRHPKVFPEEYVAIVRSGEAGGGLAKTLANLAKYLETNERLKAKIKSAIRHPMFIMGFAIIVVLVMVLLLIPKFKEMFDSAGAELPLLTRIVVSISDFMIHYFPFILLALAVMIAAYFYCLRFRAFRLFIDAVKLRLPIIGKEIIHKGMIARFCHTFGFLLGRGVGLSQSLEITAKAVNNLVLFDSIEGIRGKILSGASISQQLRTQELFPPLVSKMASVGEKTGSISGMLEKTGEYYDDELEITIQNLMALLEPVLIVFIGGIVCVVIVALYLPIFKIGGIVK